MVITQRESQAPIFTAGSSRSSLKDTAPSPGKSTPESYILSELSQPGQWGMDAVKDGEVFLMELDFKRTASQYTMRRSGVIKSVCSGKAPFLLTQSQPIRELSFWKFFLCCRIYPKVWYLKIFQILPSLGEGDFKKHLHVW